MRYLVTIVLLLAATAAEARPLQVFAAASLSDAFKDLGHLYQQKHRTAPAFNFGASNELRLQLENGVSADVFASASADEMDKALQGGLVRVPPVFVRNRLLLVVPKSNPGRVSGLADVGRAGLKLVTSHPNVPVGKYTLEVLEKVGKAQAYGPAWRDAVLKNVVSLETNVRQVLAKVLLGEAGAGVVCVSDVTPSSAPKVRA